MAVTTSPGAGAAGHALRRIAFFVPYYVDTLFPEAAEVVVVVWERRGRDRRRAVRFVRGAGA